MLRDAGLKATAQRLAVVRCLEGDETHPTAQELFDRLKPQHPTMAFATVYNTLAALTAIGACQPVQLGGATRFDPNTHPHDHAVCEGCGAVRDVPVRRERRPLGVEGFEIHRVDRIYRGLCSGCADAE